MSIKEVTALRKEGKLNEAYELAKKELYEDPNEWTTTSMFWVLRDMVSKKYIPANNIEKAKQCLNEMKELLPDMMPDDDCIGEKAYQKLCKQIVPYANVIKDASELSKSNPNEAYNQIIAHFGNFSNGIDRAMHEDLGWILYRYIKANSESLQSVQTRALLRDYMLLANDRPSMLHSMILNFALNFSKSHADFNFYNFLLMWGINNLRDDDYSNGYLNGKEIPSLIHRICNVLIDKTENVDIKEFVNKFSRPKTVLEELRQSYFWRLMHLFKNNQLNDLWRSFDSYAQTFSSLGPSHWHSEILNLAYRVMTDDNAGRFISFMKDWDNTGNLRTEDWEKEKGDGDNVYPSLAIKSAKKCFSFLKANPLQRTDEELVNWLKRLYSEVITHETEDDWSMRNYATVCFWCNSIDDAILSYKSLLLNMSEKYYLWSELAECIQHNIPLKIGLLLKAKSLEKNEDFLGEIHLMLASAFHQNNDDALSSQELNAYLKHRKEKNWSISDLYRELASQIASNQDDTTHRDLSDYIQRAEDFVYSDFQWRYFVLIEKWVNKDTERCNFYNTDKLSFSVKTKTFSRLLKKAKVGNVYKFRCKVETITEPDPSAHSWEHRTITKQVVTPLVIAASNKDPWSILPLQYGIIDYINHDKNILHLLTQESKQVFCTNNLSDATAGMFVKFREYEEQRKNETKASITQVSLCSREEALPNMRHRIVVVDDVNVKKQLFHVVLGKGKISDIIRFNQTEIRPNIGDFLNIAYCVKQEKDGKKRIKVLDVQTSDQGCEGVKGTVTGRLSVKFKDVDRTFDWETGETGETRDPAFAFVKDFYVHRDILRKYHITSDCDVIAKVVLGGDDKWKVYDLEFPNK